MSSSSSSRVDLEKFRIPLEEILKATQNFRPETKVRYKSCWNVYTGVLLELYRKLYFSSETKVRYCDVYRGILSERWEQHTAAFYRHDPEYKEKFLNELKLIFMLNHKNIISFIGFCDEGEEMIIVSRYAIGRSLYNYLDDPDMGRHITWAQRLKICLGVAKGIKYLHSGLGDGTKVIHRYIHSSSILLYDTLEAAKICGFSWSVSLPRNQSQVYIHPVHIEPYLDPIYEESGILKTDSDLYSFGVVLFEMLTGMLAPEKRIIADVQQRYCDVGLDNLIDLNIKNQIDRSSLHMFTGIAYKCISLNLKDRPTIDGVIKTLEEALDIHKHGHQKLNVYRIPLNEIMLATQDFSPETYRGGVYRGQLSEHWQNQIAAIKISYRKEDYFLTELELMPNFHHENIIPFIGYCDEDGYNILVTQYACNGRLNKYLKNPDKMSRLTWTQRLKICLGVARGLKYLHSGLGKRGRVIHREPKSGNIVLDDNLEAKICNFGLSVLIPRNQLQVYEKYVSTLYYSDPVYKESGILQTKSDLYIFGVLLFEMLSGIIAYDDESSVDESFDDDSAPTLMNLVRRYYDDGVSMLVDPFIKDQVTSQSLLAFTQLAYECVDFNIKARPSTNRIVRRLEAILLDAENDGASSATTTQSYENKNLEDFFIPIEEIKKATKDFSKKTLAGKGGFGSVYKGQLSGRTVAIKCLNPNSGQGKSEFLHELRYNFCFHHENIIPFIGYCDQDDVKIIITEYAINGSLDDYLEDEEKRGHLTWKERLQICLGAAEGLNYLHSGRGEDNRVIHRDIKSGNILLDEKMVPKICDFGMSKLDPANQPHTGLYTKVAGTNFYIDPIYQESGKLRVKSDVYSFGVVMFELLSGRMAYVEKPIGEGKPQYLINLTRRYYASGVDMLMDPLIRDQTDTQSFLTFQELAYECINMNHKERPTMETIIDTIEEALHYQESYLQRHQLQGLSIGSSSKGNGADDKT